MKDRSWSRGLLGTVGLLLAFGLVACSKDSKKEAPKDEGTTATAEIPATPENPSELRVRRADFGDAWPLTIDEGVLSCEPPRLVVFTTPEGKKHALNGSPGSKYPRLGSLWARDTKLTQETGQEIGMSLEPLISKGLTLCGK